MKLRRMNKMKSLEVPLQKFVLMGRVEDISKNQGLVPPVEVNVVDADGTDYDFEYSPEYESVNLPPVTGRSPLFLRLTDVKGTQVEQKLTDLKVPPEWGKLQSEPTNN